MDAQDALFEDLQALSDDAEALGLTDVALVLEFAMDVFLRDCDVEAVLDTKSVLVLGNPVRLGDPVQHLKRRAASLTGLGWSMSRFPLDQINREAS